MWYFALAAAFVAAGSVDLMEVDPHTAYIEWADGKTEEIHAQNGSYCIEIAQAIANGKWKLVERENVALKIVVCRRGGPYTGGSCIEGYQGPRAEGYCR